MKTIIAGSREYCDKDSAFKIFNHINKIYPPSSLILFGGADGVDTLGFKWAKEKLLPIRYHIPYWHNNNGAGLKRNTVMSMDADRLIAIWDGKSTGTLDMVNKSKDRGMEIFVFNMKTKDSEYIAPETVFNWDKEINIYCDGASRPKTTKEAGWGWISIVDGEEFTDYGRIEPPSTNNVGEMTAIINSLKKHAGHNRKINVFSDSEYCIKGITIWSKKWARELWPNKLKNVELWKELYELNQNMNITWNWIKGHSGYHYNEIADKLASKALST